MSSLANAKIQGGSSKQLSWEQRTSGLNQINNQRHYVFYQYHDKPNKH